MHLYAITKDCVGTGLESSEEEANREHKFKQDSKVVICGQTAEVIGG
jgi:hypothetical protein